MLDKETGQITLAKALGVVGRGRGSTVIRLVANATDCMNPPRTKLAKVNILVKEAYVEDIKHHGTLNKDNFSLILR